MIVSSSLNWSRPTRFLNQAADRMSFLRRSETACLKRLRESAESLEITQRQKVVRLLVKDVLVDGVTITIRHSIPPLLRAPPTGTEPPPADGKSRTDDQSYLLRSVSDHAPAGYLSVSCFSPLSRTPSRSHSPMSRRIRGSAIRCATIRSSSPSCVRRSAPSRATACAGSPRLRLHQKARKRSCASRPSSTRKGCSGTSIIPAVRRLCRARADTLAERIGPARARRLEGRQPPAANDDDRVGLAVAAQSIGFIAYPLVPRTRDAQSGAPQKDNHRRPCKEAARGAVEIRDRGRRHRRCRHEGCLTRPHLHTHPSRSDQPRRIQEANRDPSWLECRIKDGSRPLGPCRRKRDIGAAVPSGDRM